MATETHGVKFSIEGDSTSLVGAASKAKAEMEAMAAAAAAAAQKFDAAFGQKGGSAGNLGPGLVKLNKENKALAVSSAAASKGVSQLGQAFQKGGGPLLSMTKSAAGASFGMTQLGQGAVDVIKAFGPWGLAIGLVGDGLITLVSRLDEADAKARAFADRRREERIEFEKQKRTDFITLTNIQRVDDATQAINVHIQALESARDMAEAAGLATDSYTAAILNMQAAAKRQSKVGTFGMGEDAQAEKIKELEAEAVALERQANALENNAKIRDEVARSERSRGGGGATKREKDDDPVFKAALAESRAAGNVIMRDGSDTRELAAGLEQARMAKVASQIQRGGPAGGDRAAMDEVMRGLELERTTERERELFGFRQSNTEAELRRIETERAAKVEFFEAERLAATDEISRLEALGSIRQTEHEAQLARIEAEKTAEQERAAIVQQVTSVATSAASQMVTGLIGVRDARVSARNAALAQGKTEKEAARAGKIAAIEAKAAQLQSLRDLAITKALEQTAMGIGALASFNFVSAGLHFAAAGVWGGIAGGAAAGSRSLSDRATGMHRRDSLSGATGSPGAGGGAGSSGSSSSGGSASPGSDSPIPSSANPGTFGPSGSGPSAPSAGGRDRGSSNVTTIVIQGDVIGTPPREFVREIDQQLNELGQSRRRRAGGE